MSYIRHIWTLTNIHSQPRVHPYIISAARQLRVKAFMERPKGAGSQKVS